jgi:hypothetical protein
MSWSKATRLPGISRQRPSGAASSALARRHRGRTPPAPGHARSDCGVDRFRVVGWCTPARRSTACTSDLVRADIPASAAPAFNTRGEAQTTPRAQPTSETSHARPGPAPRGTQGACCVLGVRLRDGPRLQHRRAPRPLRDPPARRWPARSDRRADRLALARLVPRHPRGGARARDLGDEPAETRRAFSKSRRGARTASTSDVVGGCAAASSSPTCSSVKRQVRAQCGGGLLKARHEAAPSPNSDKPTGGSLEAYAPSGAPPHRPAGALDLPARDRAPRGGMHRDRLQRRGRSDAHRRRP